MSELLPCPFCGNSNILNPINDNGWLCKVCGSEWYRNTRPIEDKLTAELARLKENVELFANQLQAWGLDEAAKEIIGEILGGKVNAPDYRQLRAELARRDEKIAELQFKLDSLCPCETNPQDEHYLLVDEVCPIHGHPHHEIARRDEIIARLKEDAERLASNYVIEAFPHEWVCRGGCHHWARFGEQIDHAPDCPVALHRALMNELEEG